MGMHKCSLFSTCGVEILDACSFFQLKQFRNCARDSNQTPPTEMGSDQNIGPTLDKGQMVPPVSWRIEMLKLGSHLAKLFGCTPGEYFVNIVEYNRHRNGVKVRPCNMFSNASIILRGPWQ